VELADVDEAFFAGAAKAPAAHRERRERPAEERPEKTEPAEPVPPAAAASSVDTPEQAVAAALPSPDAVPVAPMEDDDGEGRRRGRRDDRAARVTSPAEQAWGQPIGTPRLSPPPAPVVIESAESGPSAEGEKQESGAETGGGPETKTE
jgi:hypothetical protein